MQKGKKETLYSLIFNVASKAITYLLLLVFANYFTKAAFGRASFVLSVFNITILFALIGSSNVFIVWYVRKKDVSSIFYFLSILTGISMIVWAIVAATHSWMWPIVAVFPFLMFGSIGSAILFSKHKYHLVQLTQAIMTVAVLIGVILFSSLDKAGIILAYGIAFILAFLIYILLTKKELLKIIRNVRLKWSSIKGYLLLALVSTLISLSFSFLGWVDSTILGMISTFENVAVYSIVGPISNVLALIPITLGSFLLTRISELRDRKTSRTLLLRVLRISFSSSLMLALFLASTLPLVFRLFFPAYRGDEIYAVILFLGMLLYGAYFLSYTYTMGHLNPRKALFPIVSAAILNIALDFALIPQFGMYGITIATTLAHLTAFVWLTKRLNFFEETKGMLLLIPFVLLAFYMGYWGLVLVPISVALLIKMDLIQNGDIKAVINPIKNIVFRKH